MEVSGSLFEALYSLEKHSMMFLAVAVICQLLIESGKTNILMWTMMIGSSASSTTTTHEIKSSWPR